MLGLTLSYSREISIKSSFSALIKYICYTHKTPTNKEHPTMLTEFQDIQVHETHQLEAILNGTIVSRKKLTHWPLSYVEKIILTDNTCFIPLRRRNGKRPQVVAGVYNHDSPVSYKII